MTFGFINKHGKCKCASCNCVLSKEENTKLNFCPKCGNPLNLDAGYILEKRIAENKIKLLYELKDELTDPMSKITIDEFINQLDENYSD